MDSKQALSLHLPIVNISQSNKGAPQQLLDAAREYGFVFIENNEAGVPAADIARTFNLSREFFASPLQDKKEVAIGSNKAGGNYGWLSRGIEKLDPGTQQRADVKEYGFLSALTRAGTLTIQGTQHWRTSQRSPTTAYAEELAASQ